MRFYFYLSMGVGTSKNYNFTLETFDLISFFIRFFYTLIFLTKTSMPEHAYTLHC